MNKNEILKSLSSQAEIIIPIAGVVVIFWLLNKIKTKTV
jgi:hypothetical protein